VRGPISGDFRAERLDVEKEELVDLVGGPVQERDAEGSCWGSFGGGNNALDVCSRDEGRPEVFGVFSAVDRGLEKFFNYLLGWVTLLIRAEPSGSLSIPQQECPPYRRQA
jgi:hypothetical protein